MQLPGLDQQHADPQWFHTDPGSADAMIYMFSNQLAYLSTDSDTFTALSQSLLQEATPIGRFPKELAPPPQPQSPQLRNLAQLVSREPTLAIESLASTAMMSPRNLQRRWAAETGWTLGRWRNQRRLHIAAQSLTRNPSVSLAAATAQFESTAGFIRAFRRVTGLTPGRFALLHLNGERGRGKERSPVAPIPSSWRAPTHRTWPRVNATHVAIWAYRGTCQVTISDSSFTIEEGESFVIPAGSSNSLDIPDGSIVLPTGYVAVSALDLTAEASRPQPINAPADYLLHCLVSAYSPLRPPGYHPSDGFTAATGLPLTKRADPQYSAKGLPHAISDNQLARLNHAREALAAGTSISEASRNAGYGHLSSFSRAFRRQFAMSPSEYATRPESQADWRRSTVEARQ